MLVMATDGVKSKGMSIAALLLAPTAPVYLAILHPRGINLQ